MVFNQSFDPFSLSVILYEEYLNVEVHPNLFVFSQLECIQISCSIVYVDQASLIVWYASVLVLTNGYVCICLSSKSNNEVVHSNIFAREFSHYKCWGQSNTF